MESSPLQGPNLPLAAPFFRPRIFFFYQFHKPHRRILAIRPRSPHEPSDHVLLNLCDGVGCPPEVNNAPINVVLEGATGTTKGVTEGIAAKF